LGYVPQNTHTGQGYLTTKGAACLENQARKKNYSVCGKKERGKSFRRRIFQIWSAAFVAALD